ncbi:unnamed protein product [Dovyalis caffra]|uniref:Uncharacterized protein n=1 Tax=Dovyalis caffra TaxID=77055 RepID=A0AAV1RMQ5_9ROSI|nr:unnamed protein product [Dovyalis caffra]
MAKKREQERQRLEKLAETSQLSRYRRRSRSRSFSRSPPRYLPCFIARNDTLKDTGPVEVQVEVGALKDTIPIRTPVPHPDPEHAPGPALNIKDLAHDVSPSHQLGSTA